MFLNTLRASIERSTMIAEGDCVLVAFSGGPDSTALLLGLFELQSELGIRLCAAHLNHMLRGGESDADQLWCAGIARELDIPFLSRRTDVAAEAMRMGGNLEEVARDIRYTFLASAAGELGAGKIAIAHNADDQVETFLHRLVRGAGPAGLASMRTIRGQIIRPMLECSRAEVEEYLADKKIDPRIDSSNDNEGYTRVHIRKNVIPLLKALNPALNSTVANTARILAEEEGFMSELAEGICASICRTENGQVRLQRDAFVELHPALQRHVLKRMIFKIGGNLRHLNYRAMQAMLECALGRGPGVTIGNVSAVPHPEGMVVRQRTGDDVQEYSYTIDIDGTVKIDEIKKAFAFRTFAGDEGFEYKGSSGPACAYLDADECGTSLTVRNWIAGDRYRPLGSPGRQKLHDLFINNKIPSSERLTLPVFLSGGDICWVAGLRIADKFCIKGDTKRILCIEEVDYE